MKQIYIYDKPISPRLRLNIKLNNECVKQRTQFFYMIYQKLVSMEFKLNYDAFLKNNKLHVNVTTALRDD